MYICFLTKYLFWEFNLQPFSFSASCISIVISSPWTIRFLGLITLSFIDSNWLVLPKSMSNISFNPTPHICCIPTWHSHPSTSLYFLLCFLIFNLVVFRPELRLLSFDKCTSQMLKRTEKSTIHNLHTTWIFRQMKLIAILYFVWLKQHLSKLLLNPIRNNLNIFTSIDHFSNLCL